jgi:hypothetical protein
VFGWSKRHRERIGDELRREDGAAKNRHDWTGDADQGWRDEQEYRIHAQEVPIADRAAAPGVRVRHVKNQRQRRAQPCGERQPLPQRPVSRADQKQHHRHGAWKKVRHEAGVPANEKISDVAREHLEQRIARGQHFHGHAIGLPDHAGRVE